MACTGWLGTSQIVQEALKSNTCQTDTPPKEDCPRFMDFNYENNMISKHVHDSQGGKVEKLTKDSWL